MNPSIFIDEVLLRGDDFILHTGENDLILEALKRGMEVFDSRPETALHSGLYNGGGFGGLNLGCGYSSLNRTFQEEVGIFLGRGFGDGSGVGYESAIFPDEGGNHVYVMDLNENWMYVDSEGGVDLWGENSI